MNDPGAASGTSLGARGGVVHATVPVDHDRNRVQWAANTAAHPWRVADRQVIVRQPSYGLRVRRYQSRSLLTGSVIEYAGGG